MCLRKSHCPDGGAKSRLGYCREMYRCANATGLVGTVGDRYGGYFDADNISLIGLRHMHLIKTLAFQRVL